MTTIERLDGVANMQRDAALLEDAESGRLGFRVYGWNAPWVTLGRFQTPERALVADCQVPWVIRPTGGRAVLHGHDVTVGLAVPLILLDVDSSRRLRAVYESVCGVLVEALRECGVDAGLGGRVAGSGLRESEIGALPAPLGGNETDAALVSRCCTSGTGTDSQSDSRLPRPATRDPLPRSEDCFMATAPNDITDLSSGLKICGCALRLTDKAVLVQASIPAGPPLVDPAVVYAHPAPVHWISLHPEAFAEALNRAIQANWTMPTGLPSGSEN